MKIIIGYRWFETALGWHLERALREITSDVTFVGLGAPGHFGLPADSDIRALPTEGAYLWIDPAGRYFPPGIEDADKLTAGYLIDCHIGHWRESAAKFFDVVFLAQKSFVEKYKTILGHEQVYWLPLGAAADKHRDHGTNRDIDVAFVGNIDHAHKATPRARRLALLTQRYRTNEFGRPATPEQVGQIYSRAKIVFNTSIADDVTMRLFEGAACGALVLTDPIAPQNGGDALFEIGREVVVYENDEDLCAKIDHFLTNEKERSTIARAGQTRVLREHTYAHRAQSILNVLNHPQTRRLAPMRQASTEMRRRERLRVYTHLHMLDAVFDATRGMNPVRRMWAALPCLARRVLF